MKFNSRPVISVYHFCISVTQVPFTYSVASCHPPLRTRTTLFVCGASLHRRRRRRIAGVATRHVVPYSCAAARHADRWYSRCDARPLSIFVRHWNPRRILSSASPNVLRKQSRLAARGVREYEYTHCMMKSRPEFRIKYRITTTTS